MFFFEFFVIWKYDMKFSYKFWEIWLYAWKQNIFFCLDFFTYWKKPDILIPDLENSPQLRSREGVQQFFKWYLKLFFLVLSKNAFNMKSI